MVNEAAIGMTPSCLSTLTVCCGRHTWCPPDTHSLSCPIFLALRVQCSWQRLEILNTHFPRLPCKSYGHVLTNVIQREMCWPLREDFFPLTKGKRLQEPQFFLLIIEPCYWRTRCLDCISSLLRRTQCVAEEPVSLMTSLSPQTPWDHLLPEFLTNEIMI